jgi:hypothetical protein
MPGKRKFKGARPAVYERLKGKLGKRMAAAIANKGKTRAGRSAMARKSAATRKRRGR